MPSNPSIDDFKSRIDIVDVIGSVVRLRRRGNRLTGLCPFHSEKTPSFTVNADTQFYHCFGCGQGGDVISFTMRFHNVDFSEALKILSETYNIPMPGRLPREPDETALKKARLYKVMNVAAGYYVFSLKNSAGQDAYRYAIDRGLPESLIEEQQIGFAPNSWNALLRHFEKFGHSVQDGIEAGLFTRAKDGKRVYDTFRNRLMFPITDEQGRVVAFGGRTLETADEQSNSKYKTPKYVNSPESLIYSKGRMLYNLKGAREACRDDRQVILVEGYMDLLAFLAKGFRRIVASLGTALTAEQVRVISKFADEVVLIYDGDSAGQKAMERALPIIQKQSAYTSFCASCIKLDSGMDPDDFARSCTDEDFQRKIQAAFATRKDIGLYVIDRKLAQWDRTTTGKVSVMKTLEPIMLETHHPIIESEYYSHLSNRLGIPIEALKSELPSGHSIKKQTEELAAEFSPIFATRQRRTPVGLSLTSSIDTTLFKLLVHHPDLAPTVHKSGVLQTLSGSEHYPAILAIVAAAERGATTPPDLYNAMPDDKTKQLIVQFLFEGDPNANAKCAKDLIEDLLLFARREVARKEEEAKRKSLRRAVIENGDTEGLAAHLRALQEYPQEDISPNF